MRSNIMTAAIALVLFGSMAGCANNTAGYNTGEQTADNRPGMVRNGTTYNDDQAGWARREFGYGDGTLQTAPRDRTNVTDDRSLGQNITNNVDNTTRDMANGVRNAARDTRNAVQGAVR